MLAPDFGALGDWEFYLTSKELSLDVQTHVVGGGGGL